jgi:multiple sugar transport system substrate-binding protein
MRLLAALIPITLLALAAGCGGGSEPEPTPEPKRPITVWSNEIEPERLRATERIVARFTRESGIDVELVGIAEDELPDRVAAAQRARSLPDVITLPLAAAQDYARQRITDPGAATRVIDRLDRDTFSRRALALVSAGGRATAVPSDGWGQLIIYRRDVLERAGLPAPDTVEALRYTAEELNRRGMAGITLATGHDVFTQQSFEHIALAFGCELTDAGGAVTLESPACENAMDFYAGLVRNGSPGGVQDVETTRDAYLAGRAAMILWSPFLLDGLAGLRDDTPPTCEECRRDRAFLAENSGIVSSLRGPAGAAQYGELATWAISRGPKLPEAERFVEFMLSGGYVDWLALSPQGKYPVRPHDGEDLNRFVDEWRMLESGVDRKAPLGRFYEQESLDALATGVEEFRRWGFDEGQGALAGAVTRELVVPEALRSLIAGQVDAGNAARAAQANAERLR